MLFPQILASSPTPTHPHFSLGWCYYGLSCENILVTEDLVEVLHKCIGHKSAVRS